MNPNHLPFSTKELEEAARRAGVSAEEFRNVMNAIGCDTEEAVVVVQAEAAAGSLLMMIHEMSPETCTCQQCGHQRDSIERIKTIHDP